MMLIGLLQNQLTLLALSASGQSSNQLWDTIKAFAYSTFNTIWPYLKNPNVWTFFGALCAFGCLLGVWLAVKQLRLGAWANAQDIVTDEKFTDARTSVQGHFKETGYTPNDEDIEDAKLVCRRWDKLACLVKEGFISKEKVLKYWRVPMGKCWIVVQEHWGTIDADRQVSTGHTDKWNAFYALGKEAARIIRKEGKI